MVKALRYNSEGIDSRCRRDFLVALDRSMCPGADSASKNEDQDIRGGKGGRCVRLTTYHIHVPIVKKSGGLNLLEHCGPAQACNGTALAFFHPFTLSQATKVLRESRGIALLCFLTSALEGGEGSASRPGCTLPPGKTWYPLYRRLGGPQGPVWTGAENLAPHRDSIPGPSSP